MDNTSAATTITPKTPTPTPEPTPKPTNPDSRPAISPSSPNTRPAATRSASDATTSKFGIVEYGIGLRKDLGKVRRWLEEHYKGLGKTVGIRWLRRKATLIEEGKKTSSEVVYLEENIEIERVRLRGKWLRVTQYESDRRRR
ncbi:hypothetical protein BDZ91DRAFT_742604 [Kalaharituber pfeilii]|nr:hypothetical protein BDZ91DRAFT_742604 [Kalaharituber pfeilii]